MKTKGGREMKKRTINTNEIKDIDRTRLLLHTGEIIKRAEATVVYEQTVDALDWEEQELEIR